MVTKPQNLPMNIFWPHIMVAASACQLFCSKSHCLTESDLAWNAQITHCWRHPTAPECTLRVMTHCLSQNIASITGKQRQPPKYTKNSWGYPKVSFKVIYMLFHYHYEFACDHHKPSKSRGRFSLFCIPHLSIRHISAENLSLMVKKCVLPFYPVANWVGKLPYWVEGPLF